MNDLEFNKTCDFIVKLGATALGYGVSSFRLESHLNQGDGGPRSAVVILW